LAQDPISPPRPSPDILLSAPILLLLLQHCTISLGASSPIERSPWWSQGRARRGGGGRGGGVREDADDDICSPVARCRDVCGPRATAREIAPFRTSPTLCVALHVLARVLRGGRQAAVEVRGGGSPVNRPHWRDRHKFSKVLYIVTIYIFVSSDLI
jgi:hypothetical protein